VNPDWHLNFFSGVVLDMWRNAIPAETTEADISFLESELGLKAGGSVLDIACGEGRHALPLARQGCRVTGIDASPESLVRARGRSEQEGLPAEWLERDMCDLPLEQSFDAAYCFGNSFGYLSRQRVRKLLAGVYGALRAGGRFAIDTGMTAESILPTLPPNRWYRIDDIIMLSEYAYDTRASRLDITYTFIRNGVVDSRPSSSYVFTLAELIGLFEEAGLRVIGLYSSAQREAYALRAPRLLMSVSK
jgi:SAM-dependent methyltransferase